MDSNKMISVVALALAVISLAFCSFVLITGNHSDNSNSVFTEDEMNNYVNQINQNGGSFTVGGTNYATNFYSFSIVDHKLVIHSKSYGSNTIVPFSNVDSVQLSNPSN